MTLEDVLVFTRVISVFRMAVPFVQDWDLVQTLGEGAYGEYESLFIISSCTFITL